jgi:hypothetical protein
LDIDTKKEGKIWILFVDQKNEKQKHDTVGIVPRASRKFAKRDKMDIPSTYIHDRSLSWLGTNISIKISGIKLSSLLYMTVSSGSVCFH